MPEYRQTIAVDMDGTLAAWESGGGFGQNAGEWLPGAQEALRQMLGAGLSVVVHSCRATWEAGGGAVAVMEFVASGEWQENRFQPRLIVGREQDPGYHASGATTRHADDLRPELGEVGVWVGVGKPIASAYVDDRGVHFSGDWPTTVRYAFALCGIGVGEAESAVRS